MIIWAFCLRIRLIMSRWPKCRGWKRPMKRPVFLSGLIMARILVDLDQKWNGRVVFLDTGCGEKGFPDFCCCSFGT